VKQWLRERFKEPRRKWQETQILITGMNHDGDSIYIEFKLNFFVDDIKVENGRRRIALAVKFTKFFGYKAPSF
jgi:MscS family membrane protein